MGWCLGVRIHNWVSSVFYLQWKHYILYVPLKIIYKNKKAYFDYEILDEYTTGMVLLGAEIKSIRAGHINLKGSYIAFQGEEAFLKGAHVSRYAYDQNPDYDTKKIKTISQLLLLSENFLAVL